MTTSPMLAASAPASGWTTTTPSSTASGTSNSLSNMNSFLTLFTTQLQHQDPSNPLESYELASQLAQFSTVERLQHINDKLDLQQTYLASINNAQMIGAIGKEVTGAVDTMTLDGGQQATHNLYRLDSAATDVNVKIVDEDGVTIRTIAIGAKEADQYDITWDGLNDAGETMPDGSYHVEVEATDSKGDKMEVTEMVRGTASAFRVEEGIPYLILGSSNGVKLPISSVMEIQEAPPEAV